MALREWKRSESGRVAVSIENLLDGISQASGNAGVSNAVVNLLVPLEFEVHVAKPQGHAGDLRYVLTVHHKSAGTMWQHPHSFDEYEKFQKQTIEALHHGHWCSGGCPWLESFIGAAFETTKRSISASLSTVVERRRKTVLNVMQGFQHFLVNRANHSCAHTLHAVARLYLEFIYGGVIDSAHVMDEFLNAAITAPAPKTHEDMMKDSKTTKKAQRRLRAQSTSALLAAKKPAAPPHSASLASTSPASLRKTVVGTTGRLEPCAICEDFMPVKDVYIVRLPCGHRFHDECAMPKLNQKLQCPTCHLALAEIA